MKKRYAKVHKWDELIVDHTQIAEAELNKLQEKFRQLHLLSHIRTTFIIFLFEICYLVVLSLQQTINFQDSIVKYGLIPLGLNIGVYFCAKFLNNKNTLKMNKNYMLTIASALQVFIYAIVHQYYIMINAGYLITIFVSTIYDDKKLVRVTSLISIVGMIISAFVIKYDPLYKMNYKDSLNLVALICTLIIARITAEFIVTASIDKRKKITKVIQEKEEYWNGMMIDNLTGIYSRDALRPFVDKMKIRQSREPICLVMLDLDKFKNVNDTYGHQYGDEVLVNLGQTLMSYYGYGMAAFRYGGEEFLCIVEGEENQVKGLMLNVKEAFTKRCYEKLNNPNLTFSAGVSRLEGTTISEVIKRADQALYKAKNSGRNRIEIFEESPE